MVFQMVENTIIWKPRVARIKASPFSRMEAYDTMRLDSPVTIMTNNDTTRKDTLKWFKRNMPT